MNEELYNIRHSLAHLLAAAVLEHFPNAKPTIGPSIDDGFYYDIDFGEEKVPETDLSKIQKTMRELLKTWKAFERIEVSADEARKRFEGNEYKVELINDLEKSGETITLYKSGEFVDLCRGGHVENPSQEINAKAFELDRVAGAYWRGDASKPMLTRIYGLAFKTPEELQAYKDQREEAKKRDHRKLGQELDLFTFSELVGPGLPLFTPKGTLLRDLIIEKIHGLQKEFGYERVSIPHITKKELYMTSGHWEKFGDELFHVRGKSNAEFVMKPMNCPHHTQIYASKQRSYKDLPIRYTEATMVYRDEQAGELIGLGRVRSITQDDAHVFCTIEQIEEEIGNIVSVIKGFYTSLDMWNEDTYWVSLSVRDPQTPEKYLGDDSIWNKAEQILEDVAKKYNLPYKRMEGEAAFYGPKLDFMFHDAIGRERQLATAQLDFNMPRRFGLEYTDAHGEKQIPVMIHRAIAGSLERFLSIIIEHFAGKFPLWLSPVQIKVLPIGENQLEYAKNVVQELKEAHIRVELDDSANTLGKKIREVKMEKIPYFVVIGDNEVTNTSVTLEHRDEGKISEMSMKELVEKLKKEVEGK